MRYINMTVNILSKSIDSEFIQYCGERRFTEAADILKLQAENFIARAEHAVLAKWYSWLPDEIIESDPELLVFWSVAFATDQNFRAEKRLLDAKKIFATDSNDDGCIWADIELAYILYLRWDRTRALEILRGISKESLNEPLQAKLAHAMLLNLGGIDQFDEALKCGQEALELFTKLNDHQTLVRVHRHYSDVLLYQGQFQNGLVNLALAYEYAKEYRLGAISFAWLEYSTANMYIALGDFEKGEHWIHLAETHLVDQPESPLLRYTFHSRARIVQNRYDFDSAEEYYRRAGVIESSTELYLGFLLTKPGCAEEAFTLSNQLIWSGKDTDSPLQRGRYDVELGLARAGLGDYAAAIRLLQKAVDIFDEYASEHLLTSTRVYLAYFHLMSDKQDTAIRFLQLALASALENGYFNLAWWQYWAVAEVLAFAIQEQIEPEFVEIWAKRRLSTETSQPFLKLINDDSGDVRTRARDILSYFGNSVELEARELLNGCTDRQIKNRLLVWLNDGWLTPVGILALKGLLGGWRRIEIFLLWCCPHLQGQRAAMITELEAHQEYIAMSTLRDNIKNIQERFEDVGVTLAASGAPAFAYDVAVRRGYIDPQAPITLMRKTPSRDG